jgi:diguanylate cyclase (GGDEF)-like protein/PAS domain S-box-containing protein
MHFRRTILRHTLLSLAYTLLYLALNQPEVIFLSRLGFTAWYPATGLTLALMLGVNPWYGLLVCFSDALAGALIYHQALRTFGETVGAVGLAVCYGTAAYLLRGPLHIDLGLRRRQDVVRYLFVTIAAAILATAIGVACLAADKSILWNQFWPSALGWFFGDAIGLLAVAPFLLIHVFPWIRNWLAPAESPQEEHPEEKTLLIHLGGWAEAIAQASALVAVLWMMFDPTLGTRQGYYLCFIPIIWIAMRQGIRRAVTGLLLLDFGIVAAMHIFTASSSLLSQVGLLMLVVSGVGLIVGSAVTERHRIALELQEQTICLNSLIENNPMGIAVLDREGRVEVANAAFEKLFQYDRSELAGRDLDPILSPEDEPMKSLQITRQVFAGEIVQATVRRRRKDSTLLDLEVHGVPLSVKGRVRRAFTIYKDISDELKASEKEKKNTESLGQLVEELRIRTTQMTLLNEMGDLLECCGSVKEACAVVSQYVQRLFPEGVSGALYLFKASRNVVEAAVQWGALGTSQLVFPLEACWALRRGNPHWSVPAHPGISCLHLPNISVVECLCVPMVGQEDTLGVLHLQFAAEGEVKAEFDSENLQDSRQRLATTVAGQVAFSLTSLRLRETLRDQSIRDPLTGLFNRRFMEESLNRELLRAARKRHSVALLFLDLDNFKHFNDAFGHDAGDLVLRSIAELFRRFFRSDDVCCRYGGEEFALILPESSADYAAIRANALRDEIKKLDLQYKDRALGTVSVSIGVAAFPEHGSTSEELLGAADRCLYESKGAGRDTVTVATPQRGQTPSGVLR